LPPLLNVAVDFAWAAVRCGVLAKKLNQLQSRAQCVMSSARVVPKTMSHL